MKAPCDPEASTVRADFPTTQWSSVLTGPEASAAEAEQASKRFCELYWPPVYSLIRRKGRNPHDAQDLTQAFFEHFIENQVLLKVRRTGGKFRSFLHKSVEHFLIDEWEKERAKKRGGGIPIASYTVDDSEVRFVLEPKDSRTPEMHFHRTWALTLLEDALGQIKQQYQSGGKAKMFEILAPALTGLGTVVSVRAAEQLGTSEGNVKVLIHRLRQQFGEVLRAHLANLAGSPDEVEDEIRFLIRVVSDEPANSM